MEIYKIEFQNNKIALVTLKTPYIARNEDQKNMAYNLYFNVS